ncbi:hypothetical protein AGMMS49992_08950 [Clostridia bacterium]|nr:hypothetical protein AGMMS49992_08950 [Clostridia bacterium]
MYQFSALHLAIKRGLRREAEGNIEGTIKELAIISKEEADERLNSALVIQLRKLAEKFEWQIFDTYNQEEEKDVHKKELEDILCSIAFCKIYGEKLPISIALRMFGSVNDLSTRIFRAIMSNSLLLHSSNLDGEPAVEIRSELEAKLLLDLYNRNHMDVLTNIIDHISPSGDRSEITAIQNMLRRIGPNNFRANVSLWRNDNQEFDSLIENLSQFRRKGGCYDLIIPEITLAREVSVRGEWLNDSERITRLNNLRVLAESYINDLVSDEMNASKANLYVEWALLCNRISEFAGTPSADYSFMGIERKMKQVIDKYPKNAFAYTAYLWAGVYAIESMTDEDNKIHSLKKLGETRDLVENEFKDARFDDNSSTKFDENVLAKIDTLIDKISLNEDRFEKSIEDGKAYGLYFKVKQISGIGKNRIYFNKPLTGSATSLKKCREILALLNDEKYRAIVEKDSACMYMFVNTLWLCSSKKPTIPQKEHECIGLAIESWIDIYNAAEIYLDELCIFRPPMIVYLLALCSAHIPEKRHECQKLFEELRKALTAEKRALYSICNQNGEPLKFTGRLRGHYNVERNQGYMTISDSGFSNEIFFRAEKIGRLANQLKDNEIFYDISVSTSFSGFQIYRQ